MNEADLKRDLVRTLLLEGGWARRIEDKFAVGTLDMLLVTRSHVLYADAKMLNNIVTLPASKVQANAIQRFNEVGNPKAKALLIGYRDKHLGFGLPGERWDAKYTVKWPLEEGLSLTVILDTAVIFCFSPLLKERI